MAPGRELVPSAVAVQTARAHGADNWLAELPSIVAALEQEWSFTTGEVMDGGSSAFVADATTRDGAPAVLKIGIPTTVDRTGRRRKSWGTIETKAPWLAGFIEDRWDELDQPCRRETIDEALRIVSERQAAFSRERCVLLHGDAHSSNVLDAGDGTWKLIDPDGLYGEPEYDLAIPMREYKAALLEGGRPVRDANCLCDVLASTTGFDRTAIWQWGLVERFSF